jgi:hypothetical protein
MLGIRGVQICTERRMRFINTERRTSGHPGSKRPNQKAWKQGYRHFRHNRALNDFNELMYSRGLLDAVRRDYR